MTIEHEIWEMTKEVRERTARMETRMVSMATQLGVDVNPQSRLTAHWTSDGVVVEVPGLDVSISKIRNYLQRESPTRHGTAKVFRGDVMVATVIY